MDPPRRRKNIGVATKQEQPAMESTIKIETKSAEPKTEESIQMWVAYASEEEYDAMSPTYKDVTRFSATRPTDGGCNWTLAKDVK
jgi:hypothetical protein